MYRKGSVKQLKKKQENDAAKETSCSYNARPELHQRQLGLETPSIYR